jgi:ribosomal protein L33
MNEKNMIIVLKKLRKSCAFGAVCLVLVSSLFTGCGDGEKVVPQVATPTISEIPDPDVVATSKQVRLVCATPEAKFYYTSNNAATTPGTPNTTGVPMNPVISTNLLYTTTFKVIAAREHWRNSEVLEYTVFVKIAAMVASPAGGSVTSGTKVYLTCNTPNVKFYYTTGTTADTTPDPLTSGSLYTQPISITGSIDSTKVIKAIATRADIPVEYNSNVLIATYRIVP